MNEYIFTKIDYKNDSDWVLKDFFNSLHLSKKLLWGMAQIINQNNFVIYDTYCYFPDLNDPDPDFHFSGVMFGVYKGEKIVPDLVAYDYIKLVSELYLKKHPEDTEKVYKILSRLPK